MRRATWAVVGMLCAVAWASSAWAGQVEVTARQGRSVRGLLDGQAVLVLRGDAYERGYAHGYLGAKEILGSMQVMLPILEGQAPGTWEGKFVPLMARFEFSERDQKKLAGMLAGIRAALPEATDRMLETLGREVTVEDLKVNQCLGDILGMACSSFSVWGPMTEDGQAVTARNLDYIAFPVRQYSVIVAEEPTEAGVKKTIDLAFFGGVGASTVMNEDGLFVAIHDGHVKVAGPEGAKFTARVLALRAAVETADPRKGADGIAEKLRGRRPGMSTSFHVSCPIVEGVKETEPGVIEWDGRLKDGGVTVRRGKMTGGSVGLVCTNHFAQREDEGAGGNSVERFTTLTRDLRTAGGQKEKVGLEEAKGMLDAVGRNGERVTFLSCVVWPAKREMVLGISPEQGVSATKAGKWVEFGWGEIFGAE
ncbi:MAG: hypothetical protein IT442_08430 [Phycisphaeraceae bacterium]|nr:hypothetical protein [Phycisphaeraceae bacterium]